MSRQLCRRPCCSSSLLSPLPQICGRAGSARRARRGCRRQAACSCPSRAVTRGWVHSPRYASPGYTCRRRCARRLPSRSWESWRCCVSVGLCLQVAALLAALLGLPVGRGICWRALGSSCTAANGLPVPPEEVTHSCGCFQVAAGWMAVRQL